MSEFYNGTIKTIFVKLQTLDGKVVLGINTPVTQENNFMDAIGLKDIKLDVRSDHVTVEANIDILQGTWSNRAFDDVIEPLVEEPYSTQSQSFSTTARTSQDRGIWVLQFGWLDPINGDVITNEIQLVTMQNEISVLPEAYGTINLKKTFIMLPIVYLAQTFLAELKQVREYLSLQTAGASDNEAAAQIIPLKVFELLVNDLQSIHGVDAPGLPNLESFIFAGSNFLNVGAEQAYSEWIEQPISNTSSILQLTDGDRKNTVSVRLWLDAWLAENDMEIFPVPLRTFGNGKLGFIIRYAAKDTDLAGTTEYHERNGNGRTLPKPFAAAWKPVLSTYSKNSIVSNASFSYDAGLKSAAYIQAFERRFTSRLNPNEDTRTGDQTSDIPGSSDEPTTPSNKSILLEVLKMENKTASLTLMGQPHISIMDVVEVDSGSPLFDGQYQVLGIIHTISKDDFSTDIDCIRIIPFDGINNIRLAGVNEGEV